MAVPVHQTAGSYQIAYSANGAPTAGNIPTIALSVNGGSALSTVVNTGGAWPTTPVAGPTVTLNAGLNTIRLQPAANGAGWALNWFTLTRR